MSQLTEDHIRLVTIQLARFFPESRWRMDTDKGELVLVVPNIEEINPIDKLKHFLPLLRGLWKFSIEIEDTGDSGYVED